MPYGRNYCRRRAWNGSEGRRRGRRVQQQADAARLRRAPVRFDRRCGDRGRQRVDRRLGRDACGTSRSPSWRCRTTAVSRTAATPAGGRAEPRSCSFSTPMRASTSPPSTHSSAHWRARTWASPHRGSSARTDRWTSRSAAFRASRPHTRTHSSSTASSLTHVGRASSSRILRPTSVPQPDWASGACLLIRRDLLDELGGWDDGFFMYCEDKDICRRARDAGYDVRYEPAAVVHHEGGVSAPRRA